jgi:hypothetical protein
VRLIRPFCAVRFVTETSGYECNTSCIDKWSSWIGSRTHIYTAHVSRSLRASQLNTATSTSKPRRQTAICLWSPEGYMKPNELHQHARELADICLAARQWKQKALR